MLSMDTLSALSTIIASTSTCPQQVSAIDDEVNQSSKSEQASSGCGLQVDNDVACTDTPPPHAFPDKGLDAVAQTSAGSLDLTSLPSILVTLSVYGDDVGQVENAVHSDSQDHEDSVKISAGDKLNPLSLITVNNAASHTATTPSQSSASLRTLSDTQSSVTLLNPTSVAPPRRLFKGSSLRISRTYSASSEGSVDLPSSDRLRVPSLDTRSHSASSAPPSSAPRKSLLTQTSPTAMSWLTDKSYGFTPPFTRLGISAPGVVLPLTVKEYQRQQYLKEFEKTHKEGVDGAHKLLSNTRSIDGCYGTIRLASGIRPRNLDGDTLGPPDSSSTPRIFHNRTEINKNLADYEGVNVQAAQPLLQYRCTCEAGHPCLCRRTIDHRISKIRRKDCGEGPRAESKSRMATSIFMNIVSKFNRGRSSTG